MSKKHIRMTRLSNKLDSLRIGLFKVKRQIGLVNYKLQLPKDTRIHLVFYVLLLELALRDMLILDYFIIVIKEEYKVEGI